MNLNPARNPWYAISAVVFLFGLLLLLQDAGLQTTPLVHDLATLGCLHLYIFTLLALAGLELAPRGLDDARDLVSIAATARYFPFVVQLILFGRRDTAAFPIALVNFALFAAQNELLRRWTELPFGRWTNWCQTLGMAGPALLLPVLIHADGTLPDSRWIEFAWFWVAAGIGLQVFARRNEPFSGNLDSYLVLLHAAALFGLLIAPMAVGLLLARAVVLLPAFMAGVVLFCQELDKRATLGYEHFLIRAVPGLLFAWIAAIAWWPTYALAGGVPMPVILIAWAMLLERASGGNAAIPIGCVGGVCVRGVVRVVKSGAIAPCWLSFGWLFVLAGFGLLVPGVRRSLRAEHEER